MSLDSAITNLLQRLETITTRLEKVEKIISSGESGSSAPASSGSEGGADSPAVLDYQDLINQFIVPFVAAANAIGAKEVIEQSQLVLEAVNKQVEFIRVAANSKKPADAVLQNLIKPTSDLIAKIGGLKDSNRASKFANNLATVSEGISALGWVVVSPTPGPFVADMRGGSEFYSNRLLKEFKGKDQNQVDFVTHYNNFLKELQAYIKKYHTTGLAWNPRGGDAASFQSSAPAASAAPSGPGAPPPGPPPPPANLHDTSSSNSNDAPPDMTRVFGELSKGEDVTKGLKKVTADMKSKNRTDKSSVVPASAAKPTSSSSVAKKDEPTKPPVFTLDGVKWRVEYQNGNRGLVIENPEPKQTVYIFKCKETTIQIKGKVNSICLDNCVKTAVVFENAIATLETVNCTSVEIQILGRVPSVSIDKTSGVQLYLSKSSLDTEIVSSKSSEMNVLIPTDDQDFEEKAVPEQYKTFVKNGALVTEPVAHV